MTLGQMTLGERTDDERIDCPVTAEDHARRLEGCQRLDRRIYPFRSYFGVCRIGGHMSDGPLAALAWTSGKRSSWNDYANYNNDVPDGYDLALHACAVTDAARATAHATMAKVLLATDDRRS